MEVTKEQEARFVEAHECLRVVQSRGLDEGTQVLRGRFVALLRALATVQGVEATQELIREHLPRPVGELSRPYLAISNEVEIVHPKGAA